MKSSSISLDKLPTLKQLELLLALTQSESIASAGARLGLTASATSHSLRALESNLGVAVIDRNAADIALTFAGEQILPHVRDVFAALHLVQTTASASTGLKTGILRIGSFGASSSLKLLPPLLQTFSKRYPGVQVFVHEEPDAQVELQLIERRIEIGVVTLPNTRFDTLPLGTDELMAVLPINHPLAQQQSVRIEEIARDPLVLTYAGSQGLVARLFERADLKPVIAHELSQLLSILEFVARGQGNSIVASLALPERYEGVVYRPIKPKASRRIGLACLNEQRLSPAAAALWRMCRERGIKTA